MHARSPFSATVAALLAAASGAAAQPFDGFSEQPAIPLAATPAGVATADFNSDGHIDAAVTLRAFGGGGVAILLNDGAGNLSVSTVIPTVPTPRRPKIADFNNDGNPDIVFPDDGSNTVIVIRSNGNGTFQFPASFPVSANPVSVSTADFNNDGFVDIAAVSPTDNSVCVLLGDGSQFAGGCFGAGIGTSLGFQPVDIASVDLNNDGDADIVTANAGSDDVSIYYGLGNGGFFTFEFGIYIAQSDTPTAIDTADMNGNGDPDIVLALGTSNASIGWLRNDSDGGSEVFPDFNSGDWFTPVGGTVGDLALADLDCSNNGFPEALGANETTGALDTLVNDGVTFLVRDTDSPASSGSPQGVATADFDGDGDTDAIVCDAAGNVAKVYLNNCVSAPCAADLTGDGMLNFFDVSTFITLYNIGDPAADFAAPFGVLNFFDVAAYITAFNAGCP